nr:unnamed protein product [Callosobruchus analis]
MIHGGVAIYVHNSLEPNVKCVDVKELCVEGIFEACCVYVKPNYIIATIYRPPNTDFQLFSDLFSTFLEFIGQDNRYIIIGGDFNVDFEKRLSKCVLLEDIIGSYGLKSIIRTPTRVTAMSSSCIDNFIISDDIGLYHTAVEDFNLSDHYSQKLELLTTSPVKRSKTAIFRRYFDEQNLNRFVDYISRESWCDVFSKTSTNEACNTFMDAMVYYFQLCFPLKKTQVKHSKKRQRSS